MLTVDWDVQVLVWAVWPSYSSSFSFLPPSSALYSFLLLSAALVWVCGEQEVTDLRLKSSSYCQEVSDLQEALQWKDKKIGVWFHSVLYDFQT